MFLPRENLHYEHSVRKFDLKERRGFWALHTLFILPKFINEMSLHLSCSLVCEEVEESRMLH